MTDELARLLRGAADVAEVEGAPAHVAGWWSDVRRRRRRQRVVAGVGASVVAVLVGIAVVGVRSDRGDVETRPAGPPSSSPATRGSTVTTSPTTTRPTTPPPRRPLNPAGGPTASVEPASVRGFDKVRLTVADPPDTPYRRSPLVSVQRRHGDEWVTVSLHIAQPDDTRAYLGLCERTEVAVDGLANAFRTPAKDDGTIDDEQFVTDQRESDEGIADRGRPCRQSDFTIEDPAPQELDITQNLVEGEHRVCMLVAPLAGPDATTVDLDRTVEVCAPLSITAPARTEMAVLDGPCPWPGDGTQPPPPDDPLAPRPLQVGSEPDPGSPADWPYPLWYSTSHNRAAVAGNSAIAMFDLRCEIKRYQVPGVRGSVRPEDLDEVLADPIIAAARTRVRVLTQAFTAGDADALPVEPGRTAETGTLLATLRARGREGEVREGFDPRVFSNTYSHIATSPKPGGPGNAVIIWFGTMAFGIDGATVIPELVEGDVVELEMGGQVLRYRVLAPGPIVTTEPQPHFADQGDERITLFQGAEGTTTIVAATRIT